MKTVEVQELVGISGFVIYRSGKLTMIQLNIWDLSIGELCRELDTVVKIIDMSFKVPEGVLAMFPYEKYIIKCILANEWV